MFKKSTLRICIIGMLAAMHFLLSRYLSIETLSMKITFDALPILIGAMLYGTVDGMCVGLIGSFLSQLMSQYGLSITTPLWMLPAILRGLMVGLYAKKHDFALTQMQCTLVTVISSLLVTAINTLVIWLDGVIFSYETAVLVTLPSRILAGIITAVILSLLLPPLLRPLRKLLGSKSQS